MFFYSASNWLSLHVKKDDLYTGDTANINSQNKRLFFLQYNGYICVLRNCVHTEIQDLRTERNIQVNSNRNTLSLFLPPPIAPGLMVQQRPHTCWEWSVYQKGLPKMNCMFFHTDNHHFTGFCLLHPCACKG